MTHAETNYSKATIPLSNGRPSGKKINLYSQSQIYHAHIRHQAFAYACKITISNFDEQAYRNGWNEQTERL